MHGPIITGYFLPGHRGIIGGLTPIIAPHQFPLCPPSFYYRNIENGQSGNTPFVRTCVLFFQRRKDF